MEAIKKDKHFRELLQKCWILKGSGILAFFE